MDGIVSLLRALDNGTTWWMGGSSSGGGVKDRHSGLRVLSYHKSKPVGCANPRRFQYNALFHTFFCLSFDQLGALGDGSSGGDVKDKHTGMMVLSYHKSKPVHGGKNFLLIVCRKVI